LIDIQPFFRLRVLLGRDPLVLLILSGSESEHDLAGERVDEVGLVDLVEVAEALE